MGAAVLGFVVTLVMTVRARVVELAVLRALGSSRLEILRAMLLEWGVVLLLGTATGVLAASRPRAGRSGPAPGTPTPSARE